MLHFVVSSLVYTCVAFASHIDLVVADIEDGLKVAEKLNEFGSRLFLVRCCGLASREAHADGVLDPKHIG